MVNIIIGNLCSVLAMISDSVSSAQKSAKKVLLVQNISQIIYCIGAVILKGYSAAVQNAVSFVRNLVAMQEKHCRWVEYLLIALGVILGLYFNNLGFFGLLPVIANFQYSIAVFSFKDNEQALKKSFLVCVILFTIFNVVILNFVGVVSNAIVAVTTARNLFGKRKKQI